METNVGNIDSSSIAFLNSNRKAMQDVGRTYISKQTKKKGNLSSLVKKDNIIHNRTCQFFSRNIPFAPWRESRWISRLRATVHISEFTASTRLYEEYK
jgi:hypothetical protein